MPRNSVPRGKMSGAVAGVDNVEIKVTVSEKKEDAAESAFGLRRRKGQQRRIFFFDTRKLGLFNQGLVLRAREVEGEVDDTTIKIRPVDPEQISVAWRKLDGFKIEADGVAKRMIRSASLTMPQGRKEIEEVRQGKRAIAKLFSSEQEGFLSEMSELSVDFARLAVLGPVAATRWRFKHPGLPYEITAENWVLPDHRDLLELSIKVPAVQAAAATEALAGFLKELELKPEGGQQTKTRVVLEFFAKGR